MDEETARQSAAWLAASAKIDALLHEVAMAGDRISEIVGAVKSYAYLDRAPVQRIDIREGLDNTLVILNSKLKVGVDVTRHYADDLPEIEAYGSELNQVWTNLVDNAADAMGGRGAIDIYANPTDEGGVEVEAEVVQLRARFPAQLDRLASSSPSSPPRTPWEPGWGCTSPTASWLVTAAGSTWFPTRAVAPASWSPCRPRHPRRWWRRLRRSRRRSPRPEAGR